MINVKRFGTKGVVALIVALMMVAFGVLQSMPAIAEEGGTVGQGQVSKNDGAPQSDAKESEQEEAFPAERGGEDAKKDGEDEQADPLDGEREKENSPPAGLGETVVRFLQSLFFGNGPRAESDEYIEFSGQIQWNDFDDLYGNRPESVELNISAPGGYGDLIRTDASAGWRFSGSVLRSLVQGDDVSIRAIVNGYETGSVKVSTSGDTIYPCTLYTFHPHIQVRWDRADLYPPNPNTEIPFTICHPDHQELLSYSGSFVGTDCTITNPNPTDSVWDIDLENLTWPVYINGTQASLDYQYIPGTGVGYMNRLAFTEGTSPNQGPSNLGFYAIAYRAIRVKVIWEDNNNVNGNNPGYGYFQLYANGEPLGRANFLNSSSDWKYSNTFPANDENGDPIEYSISELYIYADDQKVTPPGYTQETTGSMDDGFVITLREVAAETVDIPVQKVWNDNDDLYGNRPGSVTYHLYASVLNDNGNSESEPVLVDTKVGYSANDYEVTFEDAPEKDKDGNTLTYHIGEEPIVGYKTNDGYRYYEFLGGYVPRNVFDGASPVVMNNLADMKQIYVQKLWNDGGHEADRPDSAEFTLFADGEEIESIVLTEDDSYTSVPEYDGYLWAKKFSIDYPVAYQGETITYSVAETTIEGYEVNIVEGDLVFGVGSDVYRSFVATNTYDSPTVDIPVTKTWDDNDNELNNRPSSVTYRLYAATNVDGNDTCPTEPTLVGTQTATAADSYATTFEGMPLTDGGGNAITYVVGEDTVLGYEPVEGYLKIGDSYQLRRDWVFDGTNPVAITNATAHGYGFTVMKIWDDMDDTSGRPQSATFHLWADGTEVDTLILTQENEYFQTYSQWKTGRNTFKDAYPDLYNGCLEDLPEEADLWSGVFTNGSSYYPVARNGVAISYEITEDSNPSYESVNGGIYRTLFHKDYVRIVEFVNTRSDVASEMRRTIKVQKNWEDEGHEDERPESVTIRIYADGEEVDIAELTEDNGWSYEFAGVPEDKESGWIHYEVAEDYVEGYEASIEFEPENPTSYPPYIFTITNTRVAENPTISIGVQKNWEDDNNAAGKRPDRITVRLYADGELVNSAELSEETKWSFEFSKMPFFGEDGNEIAYTLVEDKVAGYESSVSSEKAGDRPNLSFHLTNTLVKEPVADEPVIKKIVELVPTGGASVFGVVLCVSLISAIGVLVSRFRAKK